MFVNGDFENAKGLLENNTKTLWTYTYSFRSEIMSEVYVYSFVLMIKYSLPGSGW